MQIIKSLHLFLILLLLFTGSDRALKAQKRSISIAHERSTSSVLDNQKGVSEKRFARLRQGINTSHWFAQVYTQQGYTHEHFATHTTEQDIRLIKSLGFDHIRFSVNPEPMMKDGDGSKLHAAYLSDVNSALDTILRHDLAVIVDIHPEDDFKKRLSIDERSFAAFTQFWRALASHLSRRDPERVFLEVMNEPVIEDAEVWSRMQAQLVAEIRRYAPRHTIIATGHRWSSLYELRALKPLPDPNIIYNFHFYEPHTFTHQGATWGIDAWRYLNRVPYPSSPVAVSQILPLIENKSAQALLSHMARKAGMPRP